jgi:signal transduction histidine kinase
MQDRIGRRQLAALVEAGISLASELELDALLQRIADLSREVIGARYGAVGVVDVEGNLLRFVHSGVGQEVVDQIGHLPEGTGLLGVLIGEGRPLRLHEIKDHPKSSGWPEHHPDMHSFLGVPITGRRRILGRLYLTEKHDDRDFSKDDERLAMMFAAQAGVAIENANLYEEVRRRSVELARRMNELSSVERVGSLLITEVSAEEALGSIAHEARRLTDADATNISLLNEKTGELVVRFASEAHSAGRDIVGIRLGAGTSKAHSALNKLTHQVVPDLAADPEVHRETIRKLRHPRAGAFVPLVVRGTGVGVLSAYHREVGRVFNEDDLAILQIMANQAAIALENERLTEALKDLAVLEERERISKELHDGVIQSIYSVGLHLQGSMSLMKRDPDAAAARIDTSINELDNVVRDVRSYIFELLPKQAKERGVAETIRGLGRDLEVNTLANVDVNAEDGAFSGLDEQQQAEVLQIIREIISNIARHAQAGRVAISASRSGGDLVVAVEDDGVGYDPESATRGHGLDNMARRADRLGGTVDIKRGELAGMKHVLRMPLPQEGG